MKKYIKAIESEIKELEIELLNEEKIELNHAIYRRLDSFKTIINEIKNEINENSN